MKTAAKPTQKYRASISVAIDMEFIPSPNITALALLENSYGIKEHKWRDANDNYTASGNLNLTNIFGNAIITLLAEINSLRPMLDEIKEYMVATLEYLVACPTEETRIPMAAAHIGLARVVNEVPIGTGFHKIGVSGGTYYDLDYKSIPNYVKFTNTENFIKIHCERLDDIDFAMDGKYGAFTWDMMIQILMLGLATHMHDSKRTGIDINEHLAEFKSNLENCCIDLKKQQSQS